MQIGKRIEALAAVGATEEGGVTRTVYTSAEREAMSLYFEWMQKSGLSVRQDEVGNIYGRWPDIKGPAVWTGSHLDSVPNGGHFDGPVGALSSLEAVEALMSSGFEPRHPIEIAIFVGEEGTRFPSLMGSRAAVEGVSNDLLNRKGSDGVTLAEALESWGLNPGGGRIAPSVRRDDILSYVELHIEQGPVLEEAGLPVGIVQAIAGPLFFKGQVTGRADHAGSTPMNMRADTLVATAELATSLEKIAFENGPTTVATMGVVEPSPGVINVIPGRTRFTIDLRDVDLASRDQAEAAVRERFQEILDSRKLEGTLEESLRIDPTPLSEDVIAAAEAAAAEHGIPKMHLPSGAAHDAMVVATIAPAGMIFIRSKGGISHSPDEFSDLGDIEAGVMVLTGTLARLSS